jgi:HAD superfamily hydrolase (TIGR01509 family)
MALEALIFDVDGTLAETEELHRAAFNRAFAEAGLPWNWTQDLYARLLDVTGGKERIRHFARSAGGDLPPDRIADLHAKKTRIYAELVAGGALTLRPGIMRLLREARDAGVKLGIATTTTPANVEALATATLGPRGLSWFDAIAAGDEVAAKKPAPDIYCLALERLSTGASACVAVEDTLNGLKSAAGAGIATIMTTSLYGGAGPFPGALAVVAHLDDAGDGRPVDLATIRHWQRSA